MVAVHLAVLSLGVIGPHELDDVDALRTGTEVQVLPQLDVAGGVRSEPREVGGEVLALGVGVVGLLREGVAVPLVVGLGVEGSDVQADDVLDGEHGVLLVLVLVSRDWQYREAHPRRDEQPRNLQSAEERGVPQGVPVVRGLVIPAPTELLVVGLGLTGTAAVDVGEVAVGTPILIAVAEEEPLLAGAVPTLDVAAIQPQVQGVGVEETGVVGVLGLDGVGAELAVPGGGTQAAVPIIGGVVLHPLEGVGLHAQGEEVDLLNDGKEKELHDVLLSCSNNRD